MKVKKDYTYGSYTYTLSGNVPDSKVRYADNTPDNIKQRYPEEDMQAGGNGGYSYSWDSPNIPDIYKVYDGADVDGSLGLYLSLSDSEKAGLELIRAYCDWHIYPQADYTKTIVQGGAKQIQLPFMMVDGPVLDCYNSKIDYSTSRLAPIRATADYTGMMYLVDVRTDHYTPANIPFCNASFDTLVDSVGTNSEGVRAIISQVAQALEQPSNVSHEKAGSVAITYDTGKRSGIIGERIKILLAPYRRLPRA